MLNKITGWIKELTTAGVALIALAVVVQIIFGTASAFLPGDVIGSLTTIITQLGAANLVGLVAVALLYTIFNK
ncbi:hypothetical protein BHECKSOX_1356 [Bathymodiolus heckerae thiotrophic gill symbiont]|uniref:hypothetical protein n=1 Tax=Bathymodiolus heckerae thiotrophic gill symbiont TaxID=1052212 RepID=UPI0010B361AB|nr:hypothetical protein [Bathymodiolus heckerae thiotrophic gill symbiont]SHN91058.1 hypothetical protein BHECKSOX_1356 [Bathymodiolus heckerae thiotrophic gill symbiont]